MSGRELGLRLPVLKFEAGALRQRFQAVSLAI